VAGRFYPDDAEELKLEVGKYLNAAEKRKIKGEIKAIMSPHAGYMFSGGVAACGYKQLSGRKIDTVVIICNSHTAYFEGIAVDANDVWQTPLGEIPVDKELTEKLIKSDNIIKYNASAHKNEHALETQLPFLQITLKDKFKIAPILFGGGTEQGSGASRFGSLSARLAKALAENMGENDLVVVSTDMSHYPAYEDANRIDKRTLEKIKSADVKKLEEHIRKTESENIPNEHTLLCGVDGVKTAMELYNLLDWDGIEILKYANSGDTPYGDKKNVVGYGAAVFVRARNQKSKPPNLKFPSAPKTRLTSKIQDRGPKPENDLLNDSQKRELLNIASAAIGSYARHGAIPEFNVSDERLNRKEGAFVTLRENGKLRGCVGQVFPSEKPLWRVVRDMAVAAAFGDDRFEPVRPDELDDLDYEISVLSVPRKIDDWRNIEPGKHGVIIRKGTRGGVFLPQVAQETGWSLEEFLSRLCFQKAGLPPDCYKDDDTEIQVFTAQVF